MTASFCSALLFWALGLHTQLAYAEEVRSFDLEKLNTLLSGINADLSAPTSCESTSIERKSPANGICDDLYRLTCAPGEFNDGTGSATASETAKTKADLVLRQSQIEFEKQFTAALNQPGHEELRKLSLSTFGLADAPQCENKTSRKECDLLIVKGLTRIATQRILPDNVALGRGVPGFSADLGYGNANQSTSARDIDLLLRNPLYQKTEMELARNLRTQLRDQKMAERIKNHIFPEVKKHVLELIEKNVSNPAVRNSIIAKVKAIQFAGTECGDDSELPFISKLLTPNAFYDDENNKFSYCNGLFLSNRSEFSIASTIAHEIGHSFDPCHIGDGLHSLSFKYSSPKDAKKSEEEFPLSGLLSCLRSEKSIQAVRIDTSGLPYSPFCGDDQIGESFSDWVASEILPEYINANFPELTRNELRIGYSNVRRGMSACADYLSPPTHFVEPSLGSFVDAHPADRWRVNRILLVHPKIREQMGCPAEPPKDSAYCAGKSGGSQ